MGEVGTKLIFGSTLEVRRASGRVDLVTLEAGRVYYREKGDTHSARNVGPGRYHEVLVELKPGGTERR
jgi:hypothetical protein